MNKKVYNNIILFTGFVLLGIVVLQIVWLNNMSSIRRTELVTNTQQALTETVNRLEKDEETDFIFTHMDEVLPDSIDTEKLGKVKVVMNNMDSIQTINISSQSQHGSLNGTMTHDPNNDGSRNHQVVTTRTITYSPEKIETKTKNIDSIVQHMIVEMDSKELTERIHSDSIRTLLVHTLHNKGIDVGFEYAILQGDSTVYKTDHYIPSSIAMTFEAKLFPNDIFDKNL